MGCDASSFRLLRECGVRLFARDYLKFLPKQGAWCPLPLAARVWAGAWACWANRKFASRPPIAILWDAWVMRKRWCISRARLRLRRRPLPDILWIRANSWSGRCGVKRRLAYRWVLSLAQERNRRITCGGCSGEEHNSGPCARLSARPYQYRRDYSGALSEHARSRRVGEARHGRYRSSFHFARAAGRHSGWRRGFWLRVLAGACSVGVAYGWNLLRDCFQLRSHLLPQFSQQRFLVHRMRGFRR